jgi:microsomal dipeptidase-like Zn-dependent dipeptidase
LPRGIEGAESFPRVAEEFDRRGYAGDEAAKVLGGNWLRVLERLPDRPS